MKRMMVLALILLVMIGLFAANQTRLLARSPATAADSMLTAGQLYDAGQYAQAAQAYHIRLESRRQTQPNHPTPLTAWSAPAIG